MTHISEDRYVEEVEQQAKYVTDEIDVEEPEHIQRRELEEQLSHSLHGHSWFFQTHELTFYAEILEHSDTDPLDHHDASTLLDAPSVTEALELAASEAFRRDVRNAALENIKARVK